MAHHVDVHSDIRVDHVPVHSDLIHFAEHPWANHVNVLWKGFPRVLCEFHKVLLGLYEVLLH